jgi:hypothetical protein
LELKSSRKGRFWMVDAENRRRSSSVSTMGIQAEAKRTSLFERIGTAAFLPWAGGFLDELDERLSL